MEKDNSPRKVSARDFLPEDPVLRKVMDQRAAVYCKEPELDVAADYQLLISFQLGDGRDYGFSQLVLEEVVIQPRIVTVPCVPGFVAGIVNHSGRLVSVIDLGKLLGRKKQEYSEPSVIMVMKEEMQVGLLVDRVNSTSVFGKLNPVSPYDVAQGFSDGVVDNKIVLLSLEKIFSGYLAHMENK